MLISAGRNTAAGDSGSLISARFLPSRWILKRHSGKSQQFFTVEGEGKIKDIVDLINVAGKGKCVLAVKWTGISP